MSIANYPSDQAKVGGVTNPSGALPMWLVDEAGLPISASNPIAVQTTAAASTQVVNTTTYTVNTAFAVPAPGGLVGQTVQNIQVFDTSTNPATLVSSNWSNLTTGASYPSAPPSANLTLVSSNGLTNAELRATPVPFTTTELPATLGSKVSASSLSVTLASDQVLPLPTGASTYAEQVIINNTLQSISAQIPPSLGVKTAGSSLSVALASDGTLPLPSGAATSALQTTTNSNITGLRGQLPTAIGVNVSNASLSVVLASDATLPLASGAATSALQTAGNGTLTTISGQLPSSVGAKPSANSLAVVLATDQVVNTTSSNPTTIFSAQQVMTTSAVQVASQALVNGIIITSVSTNTGTVYVGPAGVTAATGYPLVAGSSMSYAVTNANAIYLLSTVAGDVVAMTGN